MVMAFASQTRSFWQINFHETVEALAVSLYHLKKHFFWTYPVFLVAIHGLIDYHSLLRFTVKCRPNKAVFASLEMLEIASPTLLLRIRQQELLYDWHITVEHFISSRCMSARKVKSIVVMLSELRFKMCQCILFAKESYHFIFIEGTAAVKLMGFHLGKLSNKLFVDNEVLLAILTR